MEKSSGSDWGVVGGGLQAEAEERDGAVVGSFPSCQEQPVFLLYGLCLCSSGWVSDLTESYQTGNRFLKALRMSRKMFVRHPNWAKARSKCISFFKLLYVGVVVLSGAIPSGQLLHMLGILWNCRDQWVFVRRSQEVYGSVWQVHKWVCVREWSPLRCEWACVCSYLLSGVMGVFAD